LAEIGDFAFANTGLQQVTVPSTVISLGKSYFLGCSNLTDVTYLCNVNNFCDPAQFITDTFNFLQDVSNIVIDISADVASVTKGSDDTLAISYTVFDPTITDPSYNGVTTQLDNNKLHIYADVNHYNDRLAYLNQALQILFENCITLNPPDISGDNLILPSGDIIKLLKLYACQLQILTKQAETNYGPLSGLPTTDISINSTYPDGTFNQRLQDYVVFNDPSRPNHDQVHILPMDPIITDISNSKYFSFQNICEAIITNAYPLATSIKKGYWNDLGGDDCKAWVNNINTTLSQLKAALDNANAVNNKIRQIYDNQLTGNITVSQMQQSTPPIMTDNTIKLPVTTPLPQAFRMIIPANIITDWQGIATFVNDNSYNIYYSLSGPSLTIDLSDNTTIDVSGTINIELFNNLDEYNYLTLARYFANPLFDTVKPQQVNYNFYGAVTNIRSLENKTNCTIDICSQVVYIYDLALMNYSIATISIRNFDILKIYDNACQNLTNSTVNINANTNGYARMGADVFLNASNISVNTNIHLINRPNVVLYDFGTARLSDISSIITSVFPNINHDNTRNFQVGAYSPKGNTAATNALPMITFQSLEDLQEYTIIGKPEDWAFVFFHNDNYQPSKNQWYLAPWHKDYPNPVPTFDQNYQNHPELWPPVSGEQSLYCSPSIGPNVISYKGFSWTRDHQNIYSYEGGPINLFAGGPQNYKFYRVLPNSYYSPGAQNDRRVVLNLRAQALAQIWPYIVALVSMIVFPVAALGVGLIVGPAVLGVVEAADATLVVSGVDNILNMADFTLSLTNPTLTNIDFTRNIESNERGVGSFFSKVTS